MNYVENVFICLAAPLTIAVLRMHGKARRTLLFLLGGMTTCLLSSYISTFLAGGLEVDTVTASMELTPVVEEIMKFLPALFYLVVFEPDTDNAVDGIMMTAIGFATFENVCFMTQNGAAKLTHLLIRGFGTGAMHVVCASIIVAGFLHVWDREWLRIAGTFGLLAMAISFHGIYNVFVSQKGYVATVGFFIPVVTMAIILIISERRGRLGECRKRNLPPEEPEKSETI
ncbi:MAG: PrsW family intramembrane metalloprotease [Lachnospiraceae bacterium]|nr:PrsW family intramembrane metalloprotease [Lachnospiraceae bacterium]